MIDRTIDGVPLLPCPFCGGEPYGTHDHYVHDDLSPMPCVECRACSAHLKAEDWNRRVQPAAQPQGDPVVLEVVGRQCFPSDEMKAVHGYRKEPWVDGETGRQPSEPGFYRVEPLVRLSDVSALYAEQPAPVAATQIAGFNIIEDPSISPGQIRMCDCNQGRMPCTCKPSAYDGFDNGVD